MESLAECADPSWPDSKWHLYLLGLANLSAPAGSTDRQLRLSRGYRYLGMRPCARTASLQQSPGLDLQPHERRARHVRGSSASALAVRVPIYAEWIRIRRRIGPWRRMAFPDASPDRSA